MNATEEFEALRPRLFSIAYRMTGSVADAEDLCQDAWVRWNGTDRAVVASSEGYLVRMITHGAIDRLRSAQHRREAYVGPYLPEPLVTPLDDRPADAAELADSLSFAFLVLLDELSPDERVALLLHDVFGYSFEEVAAIADRTPASCRQLASRSRRKLRDQRVDVRRPSDAHERAVIQQLIETTMSGNIDGLMALLTDDVVQLDDGGPRRRAARHPIVGPERVARLIVNLAKRLTPTMSFEVVRVNGDLGLLFTESGRADMVITAEFAIDGRIRRIFTQLNPDKLHHLRTPTDLESA